MRRLVALDLAPNAHFVAVLERCFDAGDAVFPVDQRLPGPARQTLFAQLRPSVVISSDGTEVALPNGAPTEDGDAFVIATSGTTGVPRGVVLTHDAVRASALATSAVLDVDESTDHWLCCLPVAHVGGLSVITRALETKTPLSVIEHFSPDALVEAVRTGVTLTSLVPTMMYRLGDKGVSLFRKILLGGSQIPAERAENTVATYGMTESASGVVYDGIPLDGIEVRVADDGEISLRAPMLLRCYRDGFDPKDKEGWFRTGDSGGFGQDGRLFVNGRIGDVIVSGGEKIWPNAVENILAELQQVKEVAICGIPDPEWGERVVAFVVPVTESDPPSLESLRSVVRDELGGFAAPREIVIMTSLPKTAIGKVQRKLLAKQHGIVGA